METENHTTAPMSSTAISTSVLTGKSTTAVQRENKRTRAARRRHNRRQGLDRQEARLKCRETITKDTNPFNQRTTQHRLSGAACKRLNYFLRKGVNKDEALIKCLDPMIPRKSEFRRSNDLTAPTSFKTELNRSAYEGDMTGSSHRCNISAANSSNPQQCNNNQGNKGIKICILPIDFPRTILTAEQLKLAENDIMELVLDEEDSHIFPQFDGCTHKPGWLELICLDFETAQWLKSIAYKIRVDYNIILQALEEKEMPRPDVMIVNLPQCKDETNENILRRLRAQNAGLCTENWTFLYRKALETDLVQMAFSLDPYSGNILRSNGMRASWLFGNVYFEHLKAESPMADVNHIQSMKPEIGDYNNQHWHDVHNNFQNPGQSGYGNANQPFFRYRNASSPPENSQNGY